MSIARFRQCLAGMNLPAADVERFPKRVHGYADFSKVGGRVESNGRIPVQLDLVVGFLRSLRDCNVQAWRRLQAARAIEVYPSEAGSGIIADHPSGRARFHDVMSGAGVFDEINWARCQVHDWGRAKSSADTPRIRSRCENAVRNAMTPLVEHDLSSSLLTAERDDFHRQSADVHPHNHHNATSAEGSVHRTSFVTRLGTSD